VARLVTFRWVGWTASRYLGAPGIGLPGVHWNFRALGIRVVQCEEGWSGMRLAGQVFGVLRDFSGCSGVVAFG
jgi:hypothetical protein